MLRSIILAIALFIGLFDSSVIQKPPVPIAPPFSQAAVQRVADAGHVIWMRNAIDGGRCTASAVGPHTLLTAAHCYVVTNEIKVDDSIRTIESFSTDGNDHLLIQVSGTPFTALLKIDQRAPNTDESVMAIGNPGQSRSVLRFGTLLHSGEDGRTHQIYQFQMFGAPGDSGSALVDVQGRIIGIISTGTEQNATLTSYELAFSPAQLAAVK
jgi:hypothetical protein